MNKYKKNKNFTSEYCYDSFQSYSPDNFSSVEWGNPTHIKQKKCYVKNSDLIIKNRFDFGNDNQVLIRSTKNSEKKLPNIFNLKKNKNDV